MSADNSDAARDSNATHAILKGFRSAWASGERPRIEEVLAKHPDVDRSMLLRRLIKLEVRLRQEAGETPTRREYAERFPEYSATAKPSPRRSGHPGEAVSISVGEQDTATYVPGATLEPMQPSRFGDYELLEELGRGGMGVVYKARQLSLDRIVALKMIRSGEFARRQELERFLVEAKAAAILDHPGIVPVFEVGEVEGCPYFSMGYVEATSLHDQVRERPLEPRRAAELLVDIAGAVQYAHDRGVVHRDLKPANILLDTGGTPRVVDFGLAKLLTEGEGLTVTGDVIGTPAYMPPEQAEGRVDAIDVRTDVYSLGAVLYHLLTGRPPFVAANLRETLVQVVETEPVPPGQLNPSVPRDLETICLKCMQKDPAGRYDTAEEVRDDLERHLSGRAIHARPISRVERIWRWCRRNPTSAIAIVTGVVAMVSLSALSVALGYQSTLRSARDAAVGLAAENEVLAESERELRREAEGLATSEREQRHRAEQLAGSERTQRERAEEAEADAERARETIDRLLYCERMRTASAALSGSSIDASLARTLLDECPERFRSWEWRLLDARLQRFRVLAVHETPLFGMCATRDGKLLAGGCADGTISVWNARTGQRQLLLDGRGFHDIVHGLACSPDGRWFASGCHNGRLRVWDGATGESVRSVDFSPPPEGPVDEVRVSPDGRTIACAIGASVTIRDSTTGEEVLSLKGDQTKVYLNHVSFSPDGTRLAAVGIGGGRGWVWDVASGERLTTIETSAPNFGIGISPDGTRGAVASRKGLLLLDLETGKTVRTFGPTAGTANCVLFTPDGKWLVTGGHDRAITVWSVADGQVVGTLSGHDGPVHGIAASADGKWIVSASHDKSVRLWDLVERREARRLDTRGTPALAVCLSPDGRRVAGGFEDGTIVLWDATTGQRTRVLEGHGKPVTTVDFSPNGKQLVSGGGDGRLRTWEVGTGRPLHAEGVRPRLQKWVFDIQASPDGRTIACALGQTVSLRDVSTGEEAVRLEGDQFANFQHCCFSPDGTRVAAGSLFNRKVFVWDTATGKPLATFDTKVGATHVCYSPDGMQLAIAGSRVVTLVDSETGKPIREFRGHEGGVMSVRFTPDGDRLVSGGTDATTRVWDVATARELLALRGHNGYVRTVLTSPDGRWVVTGGNDNRIRIWEIASRSEARTLAGVDAKVLDLHVSPDGRRVVASGGDGMLTTWDIESGRVLSKQPAIEAQNVGIRFGPKGRKVVTAGGGLGDHSVKVWDSATGRELLSMGELEYEMHDVDYSPDGKLLAGACGDDTVRIWSAETGRVVRELEGHEDERIGRAGVYAVRFSPDGRRIASAGGDEVVRLWETSTGEELLVMDGHEGMIDCVCFSSDGRRIASGSTDTVVRVWDVATGDATATLRGHRGPVAGTCFSPQGDRLASTGLDGTIRIWDVETGHEILTLEKEDEGYLEECVLFSPDGRWLVAGAGETIQIWDLRANEARPAQPPAGIGPSLLDAMQIVELRVTDGPDADGDVTIAYDFVNASGQPFEAPSVRGFHGLGSIQYWIERVGEDKSIPSIDASVARRDGWVAAGGFAIGSLATVEADYRKSIEKTVTTRGFPPGDYRIHVEYRVQSGVTVRSESVGFEIGE